MKRLQRGFSLVELLVVIAIIGVLMALLIPVLGRARQQAQLVECKSNLQQIAFATRMYADMHRDRYPDEFTVGGAFHRRGPGQVSPADPFAAPETYGLPCLYRDLKLLPDARVWICPAQPEYMREYGNTYTWTLLSNPRPNNDPRLNNMRTPSEWTSAHRKNSERHGEFWVYDNFSNNPFTSGARRGRTDRNPVKDVIDWSFPHRYRGKLQSGRLTGDANKRRGAINMLFIDGQVGMVLYVDNPENPGGAPKTIKLRSE
jgi:prepilin-type N-terminal cleavage/methylation domain-containing protein